MNTQELMDAAKADPCPCCGAAAEFEHRLLPDNYYPPRDFYHVRICCQGCGIMTDWYQYGTMEPQREDPAAKLQAEKDVAFLWNRRTALSACEGEKAGEVPTRGRPDWWLDDIKAFPETWETVESTPRKITILGDFAIDPDCYVAELEGEAGKVWVIKHSGSVLRKSSRKKLLARPIDLAPKE